MTEILHPDGSDCDYCTYDAPCVTIKNTLPDDIKDAVPNNNIGNIKGADCGMGVTAFVFDHSTLGNLL